MSIGQTKRRNQQGQGPAQLPNTLLDNAPNYQMGALSKRDKKECEGNIDEIEHKETTSEKFCQIVNCKTRTILYHYKCVSSSLLNSLTCKSIKEKTSYDIKVHTYHSLLHSLH